MKVEDVDLRGRLAWVTGAKSKDVRAIRFGAKTAMTLDRYGEESSWRRDQGMCSPDDVVGERQIDLRSERVVRIARLPGRSRPARLLS
jgi:hypothetical protein